MSKEEYNKYKSILFNKKTAKTEAPENKEQIRQNKILRELEEQYRQYDSKLSNEEVVEREVSLNSGHIKTMKKC